MTFPSPTIPGFPSLDLGEVTDPPSLSHEPWSLTLAGGRVIDLDHVAQHLTYGGWLCGMPFDPAGDLSRIVAQARKWDGQCHDHPVVIPATIRHGTHHLEALNQPPLPTVPAMSMPFAFLPPVTTFATFRWAAGPSSPHSDASALAIWWQWHFGLPTDAETLNRLATADWQSGTREWTP